MYYLDHLGIRWPLLPLNITESGGVGRLNKGVGDKYQVISNCLDNNF